MNETLRKLMCVNCDPNMMYAPNSRYGTIVPAARVGEIKGLPAEEHQRDTLGYCINDIKTTLEVYDSMKFMIKKVIFNDPATIVLWMDGTKTIVKCWEGEKFDPEKGLAMAIAKKAMGNKGSYFNEFKKWLPKEDSNK